MYANNCAMREQVVERLQSQYLEHLSAGGLQGVSATEAVIEIWSSAETGTFTVLQTQPDGVTCIMATGTDWFIRPPAAVASAAAS